MRTEFKFRHTAHSDELTEYATERLHKLEKFEMKPAKVEITFTAEKTSSRVDIHVRSEDIEMHAHADADTFFECIDLALNKMSRQLARKKSKVQKHSA